MSIFLLSFFLLDTLDDPQTYSLAFENKLYQLVCTLSTTSPTTHLNDQALMRGHPLVPLWSVWKSYSQAAQMPQQDEREEVEGLANPQRGGEPARPIGANRASAVEIRTPQVGLSCPDGAMTPHTPHR